MQIISNVSATTVVLLVMVSMACAATTKTCKGLASYQLQLNTLWSKETFHRQYPTHRPHAQWSRLIGRTHNKRYSLWSEGTMATESLKEFVEQGLSTGLDVEAQGSRGIFDAFIGPRIETGVGSSIVKLLVHSDYSKLSFVVRMIPSPDWFIGTDSLDLCTNGEWLSEKTLDLQPLDGGTDRGFTFTSPNWPEDPQKAIYVMTSTFPNHPASSFYYPDIRNLLPIAKVKISKIEMTWIDTPEEPKDNKTEVLQGFSLGSVTPAARPSRVNFYEDVSSAANSRPTDTKAAVVMAKSGTDDKPGSSYHNMTTNGRMIAKSIIRKTYRPSDKVRSLRSGRNPSRMHKVVLIKAGESNVDCVVTDWSNWSSCSKTCGFGARVRTRSVIQRPLKNGQQCPFLREEQLCGGVRSCK